MTMNMAAINVTRDLGESFDLVFDGERLAAMKAARQILVDQEGMNFTDRFHRGFRAERRGEGWHWRQIEGARVLTLDRETPFSRAFTLGHLEDGVLQYHQQIVAYCIALGG